LPSPARSRSSAARRPNWIKRVLSGCRVSAGACRFSYVGYLSLRRFLRPIGPFCSTSHLRVEMPKLTAREKIRHT
jgi:hypothetical protein